MYYVAAAVVHPGDASWKNIEVYDMTDDQYTKVLYVVQRLMAEDSE